MKNIILSVVMLIILLMAAAFGVRSFLLRRNQTGTNYYVRVTALSESRENNDYMYRLKGFDQNGKVLKLEFYGMDEKPIRKGAYLKVTVGRVSDGSVGVKRWEEIKRKDVPEKALQKIEGN